MTLIPAGFLRKGKAAAPGLHVLGSGPLPQQAFVALVPGADAPLVQLSLPQRLRGPARDAVARRQVADRLACDPATLDLRPARLGLRRDNWDAMMVIDRNAAAEWRAALSGRGATACSAMLPDYLALPTAARVWTVATLPDADAPVQVRLGPQDGFSAEPDLAALTLARTAATVGAPAAVLRLGPPQAAVDAALAALPAVPLVTSPKGLPDGLGPALVLGHGEAALDLREDRQARIDTLRARIMAVQVPAVLALAGLAAWMAATQIETERARAASTDLRAALTQQVRQDFGLTGPLLDIPAQILNEMERRTRLAGEGAGGPRALTQLQQAATILSTTPALRVETVVQQPNGSLALDLAVSDFAALDLVAAQLRDAGLDVRIGRSSATAPGEVSGTLILSGGV